ncbi:M56 family metallopeptidase [Shewanella sp.]|uniref:M56 family metallopeptidase n=1 Tax=Shewanella sp. TaxID=50422 RepID=UPI003A982BA5
MSQWLISQTIGISLLASVLLLLHRHNLKRLGIHYTYLLWLSLLLLPASSWLIQIGQQWLSHSAKPSQLAVFRVYMQQAVGDVELLLGFSILSCAYLVGVGAMLALLLAHSVYLRQLRRNALPCLLAFSSPLPIKLHAAVSSPMLCGVFKPMILVPRNFAELEINAQRCVIEHELRHQQRGDLLSNTLAWLLLSTHWFNPLVWMAYRRFRDDQELACDADATQSMSRQQCIRYGETLLHYSQHPMLSVMNTHYGNKNTLKERIMQLQQHKSHGRKRLILAMLTLSCGLSAVLLNQQVMADPQSASAGPINRVEPNYPTDAAKQHIEGHVSFKFDITADGNVSNIRIIDSQPAGVFDSEATKAFAQWQYPATGTTQQDMMVQLAFQMAPEQQ